MVQRKQESLRTDSELIELYLQGDRSAHKQIETMISRVVENSNWSLREQWQDIKQDIHQKLCVNFKQGKFEFRSPLKYYVYKVSKYTCLAYIRKKYSHPEFSMAPDELVFLVHRENNLVHEEVQKSALQMLSGECLKIFSLFFLEGYSYREIGEKLGLKEGTVKSRMFRCKERARQMRELILKQMELS
jgi:RNA polymerase sigma-70 factor (ECF subfamily)